MTPAQFKEARESRNMSQQALADMLGVTRAHINRIENHKATPDNIICIALKAIALLGPPHLWPTSIDKIMEG